MLNKYKLDYDHLTRLHVIIYQESGDKTYMAWRSIVWIEIDHEQTS